MRFATGHQLDFELGQLPARLVSIGQLTAGAARWLGEQAFVVALQPEEGLGVAADDFH